LRALLSGIVDYAGLFPPAQLPLEESIRNFARYRTEPERWMLGRFVCPAARLAELSTFVGELFRECPPLAVSALGRGGQDAAAFRDGLRQDANDVGEFRRRHPGRVTVDVYEARLPAEVPAAEITDLLLAANRFFDPRGPQAMMPFFEAAASGGVIASITEVGKARRHSGAVAGFKLRCGGAEAKAFPTPTVVALAIIDARRVEVPLKFTAGLHHPIRRHDSGVEALMHGFLNVFVAGVLAAARGLDGAEVRDILDDEDARSFSFTDEGLRWRQHTASVTEIEFARRSAVTSFGSCSFDEPRDDLRALGLL
jgi:hypothetical protein